MRPQQQLGGDDPGLTSRADAFEALFTAAVDGLVLFDGGGRITRMNPAARELLVDAVGHTPVPSLDVLRCVRITDVEGAVVPYEQLPMFAALQGEKVAAIPLALQRGDGTRLWASVGAAPIHARDGAIVGAVLSIGDVSGLRALQEQREDLSRMILHDLRAPLAVILGHAQLVDRRAEEPDAVRGSARAITRSARRMSSLLGELVESALLESGKLTLERVRVDVTTLARELCAALSASLGRRVRVEGGERALAVLADPGRFERILVNLVSNAVKYSPEGTEVIVRLGRDGPSVVVEVEDHGPGIAPDDLPHVFERYFRASRSARLEGMGLGLYTARMLAEAHGGTITVSATSGRGSVFRVRLPAVA